MRSAGRALTALLAAVPQVTVHWRDNFGQAAANSDYGSDKEKIAAVVADHLKRFWTPEMRAVVIESCR